jgi:hypothetical protein
MSDAPDAHDAAHVAVLGRVGRDARGSQGPADGSGRQVGRRWLEPVGGLAQGKMIGRATCRAIAATTRRSKAPGAVQVPTGIGKQDAK